MIAKRLFDYLSDIDSVYLQEADEAEYYATKASRRKRIVTYSALGVAVSVGLAIAVKKLVDGRPRGAAA